MSDTNQALIEIKITLRDNLDEGMEYDSEGEPMDETHPANDVVEEIFDRYNLGTPSILIIMGREVVLECKETSLETLRRLVSQNKIEEISLVEVDNHG